MKDFFSIMGYTIDEEDMDFVKGLYYKRSEWKIKEAPKSYVLPTKHAEFPCEVFYNRFKDLVKKGDRKAKCLY